MCTGLGSRCLKQAPIQKGELRMRKSLLIATTVAIATAGLGFGMGFAASAPSAPPGQDTDLPGFSRVVFLSHVNDPSQTPVFPGDPAFSLTTVFTVPGDGFYLQFGQEGEHTGTHYSSPCHFHVEARCADQLAPGDFVLPAVVIDIRERVAADTDYLVTVADLKDWEATHGEMPQQAAVLLLTGCDAFWGPELSRTRPTYYNCGDPGRRFRQPGFTMWAVKWLIKTGVLGRRGALGTDTFGPDPSSDPLFLETWLTLRRHRFTLENLTNLRALPATGAWVVIGGPRNSDGSGAPASIFALVP